ncbi:hypothetical protein M427DRAFT_57931 [Gonapodya prolifera JEL478]|uniref:Uncharacterized protein n=1 Tax=Gonapodya prolifera (strain JEL478) TaxID=1344416 RepID=A0A139ABH1_GONPJ|nr:hypothetical protein M427DRAFT_57931 [Gonapodya prolifera JEL478]|eukprot:KXS14172.1 hypothetical protein M427DRAFT_57931 [Gonapodya prolifera JEL478]
MECLMRDSKNQSFSVAEVLPQNSKRMLSSESERDRNLKSASPFESSSSLFVPF